MSDSVRPHRWQPTRLPCPWDFPGKNTGVGCHFLLQCMKAKSEVAQRVQLFATPQTAAYQAPPSMGFSRQGYWSGVPLPSPCSIVCSSIFSYLRNPSILFSIATVPVYIPTNSAEGFSSLHTLSSICCLCFLHFFCS